MSWSEKHLKQLKDKNLIAGFTISDCSVQVSDTKVKSKNKFGNKEVVIDGFKFQSIKESSYYLVARMRQLAGEIKNLQLQKRYLLIEGNEVERKCEYVCDFYFIVVATDKEEVVDVKSVATRKLSTYIMKRKLMLDRYGIQITEI